VVGLAGLGAAESSSCLLAHCYVLLKQFRSSIVDVSFLLNLEIANLFIQVFSAVAGLCALGLIHALTTEWFLLV
jgi:hypothetical protein